MSTIVLAGVLSACGAQINTLRSAAKSTTSGVSGVPPQMTSLTLTDLSPTKNIPLNLHWGVEVGAATIQVTDGNASTASATATQ